MPAVSTAEAKAAREKTRELTDIVKAVVDVQRGRTVSFCNVGLRMLTSATACAMANGATLHWKQTRVKSIITVEGDVTLPKPWNGAEGPTHSWVRFAMWDGQIVNVDVTAIQYNKHLPELSMEDSEVVLNMINVEGITLDCANYKDPARVLRFLDNEAKRNKANPDKAKLTQADVLRVNLVFKKLKML
ncbi:hypothetical protein ACK3TF_005771 [Chlorella vulgaris]